MMQTFTLNLVNFFLFNTESQSKVDTFEDPIMTGPENIGGFEISVNNSMLMKSVQGNKDILGKL